MVTQFNGNLLSIIRTSHFGTLVTLLDPGMVGLKEARIRNLKIGFELMLTPMLRNLDARRDRHIEILRQCGQWMGQKKLGITISQVLPLSQAAKAHQIIENGHAMGKIVLNVANNASESI